MCQAVGMNNSLVKNFAGSTRSVFESSCTPFVLVSLLLTFVGYTTQYISGW